MSTTPKPASISRRESLKRAAGALALGLGAPATVLAAIDSKTEHSHLKLSFYKLESRRPDAFLELPHDVAEKLMDRDGVVIIKQIKFENADVREPQLFEAWPCKAR